jgi:hypothetical protein
MPYAMSSSIARCVVLGGYYYQASPSLPTPVRHAVGAPIRLACYDEWRGCWCGCRYDASSVVHKTTCLRMDEDIASIACTTDYYSLTSMPALTWPPKHNISYQIMKNMSYHRSITVRLTFEWRMLLVWCRYDSVYASSCRKKKKKKHHVERSPPLCIMMPGTSSVVHPVRTTTTTIARPCYCLGAWLFEARRIKQGGVKRLGLG